MFVLAHLSDPHLGPLPKPMPSELIGKRGLGYLNWLRKRRRVHRPEVLAAIVTDVRARWTDHIAVTGDLVNLSLSREFEPARAWLDRLGAAKDVTFVPGNHDAYVRATASFARRDWGDYMRGDHGEDFPFVRQRGPVALIGLSSSVPTLPLAATGRLGTTQLRRTADLLWACSREALFRIVLIHHPPATEDGNYFRRLRDAPALRAVLQQHGADLVLHGHHHTHSLIWLDGPAGRIPVIGVASASGSPAYRDDPGGYNLYEIDGKPGAWRCTMVTRGMTREDGSVREIGRTELFAPG